MQSARNENMQKPQDRGLGQESLPVNTGLQRDHFDSQFSSCFSENTFLIPNQYSYNSYAFSQPPPFHNVPNSVPPRYSNAYNIQFVNEGPNEVSREHVQTIHQQQNRNGIDDVTWLKKWSSMQTSCPRQEPPTDTIKIHEIKNSLKLCLNLLEEMKSLKKRMDSNFRTMDSENWQNLTTDFQKKEGEVSFTLEKFSNIRKIKKVIDKRRKKRLKQQLHKTKQKEKKLAQNEKRCQLHHQIDTWLQDMQGTIDRAKREESLKKEADTVLAEVIRKKAEGRRQAALLTALMKLRQLRAKSSANKGQHYSAESGIRFAKVTEHLKKLWEKQLREYNTEEQGMRVMLSEAVDERVQLSKSREKQILSKWEHLIFGSRTTDIPEFYLAAHRNSESFISIRRSWDEFLAPSEVSVQSKVPVGWVLPANPSSSEWESLLLSDKASI